MKWFFALIAAALAAVALAGVASAGCWATVGLSSTPTAGLAAGEPWVVTIRVLQHGRTPMPNARPEVRIRRRRRQGPDLPGEADPADRVVPSQSRVPAGRPLFARHLRRIPGQGVREVQTLNDVVIADF